MKQRVFIIKSAKINRRTRNLLGHNKTKNMLERIQDPVPTVEAIMESISCIITINRLNITKE